MRRKKETGGVKKKRGKKCMCINTKTQNLASQRERKKGFIYSSIKKYVDYTITETIKENRENNSLKSPRYAKNMYSLHKNERVT